MIHELTIGHLDLDAIHDRIAVAVRPLDAATVARVMAELPGLKVEQRDCYLIDPWHGREDAERGEAFAESMRAETEFSVVDRRSGRIIEFGRLTGVAPERMTG